MAMSASIWVEVESGSDRRPAPQRRHGYWSGNQGQPIRRPLFDRDELGVVARTARPTIIR
jgi:hypothetical protein